MYMQMYVYCYYQQLTCSCRTHEMFLVVVHFLSVTDLTQMIKFQVNLKICQSTGLHIYIHVSRKCRDAAKNI